MNHSLHVRKFMGALMSALLLLTTTLPAQAAMVGTDQVLNEARAEISRAELVQMLDRKQVQSELRAMGVDPSMARERVERMTDAEVARLQGQLAQLPAGGDALSVVLVIFLVFVITDVIGATDIFPFINSVE